MVGAFTVCLGTPIFNHYQGTQTPMWPKNPPSVLADPLVFRSPTPGKDLEIQKLSLGIGEVAQSEKCLSYRDEGLCYIPRTHTLKRKSGKIGHTGNPSTEKTERGETLGLAHSLNDSPM